MACANHSAAYSDGPAAWLLDGGARLHLQHGPIDLIIDAVGCSAQVHQAYEQAVRAFKRVLESLTGQLPLLRSFRVMERFDEFEGDVALRMRDAVLPFSGIPLTPMICVAGAVADHVLGRMIRGCQLERAQVNNGGDIALHLTPDSQVRVGISHHPAQALSGNTITVSGRSGIRGIATSGWRGRSFSLGVADAVTVLAKSASSADCAATLIANAVDLPGSDKVRREPAESLQPDSDLAGRTVTTAVSTLSCTERTRALRSGTSLANEFVNAGLVHCVYIHLQGDTRVVGAPESTSSYQMSGQLP